MPKAFSIPVLLQHLDESFSVVIFIAKELLVARRTGHARRSRQNVDFKHGWNSEASWRNGSRQGADGAPIRFEARQGFDVLGEGIRLNA